MPHVRHTILFHGAKGLLGIVTISVAKCHLCMWQEMYLAQSSE